MTDTPLEALIVRLVASEGSRELDIDIHNALFPPSPPTPLPPGEEVPPAGFGDDEISREMHEALHYTTSIDAKLPGENIVEMKLVGQRYEVWHRAGNGLTFMGEHKIEVIARRIAALRARA